MARLARLPLEDPCAPIGSQSQFHPKAMQIFRATRADPSNPNPLPMRPLISQVFPLIFLLLLSSGCSRAADSEGSSRPMNASVPTESAGEYTLARDITYKPVHRRDTGRMELQKLDLYYKEGWENRPVVVFIHGGGWVRGDKSNIQRNPDLWQSFLREGLVLASVNFRLPQDMSGRGITYRDQVADIAAAIKWLTENVSEFGGDPDRLFLFGYSSGAHLAALIGLNERLLAKEGLPVETIKGVVAVDVHAYDVPQAIREMQSSFLRSRIPMMKNFFGFTSKDQLAASPINYVDEPGRVPFLIISAGQKEGSSQLVSKAVSERFHQALTKGGHSSAHVHFSGHTHSALVMGFGKDSDAVAPAVLKFLSKLQ